MKNASSSARITLIVGTVVLAGGLLTGSCSQPAHSSPQGASPPPAPASVPPSATPPPATLFAMCDVMTGPEVTALSPFGNPLKTVNPDAPLDGYTGCHYEFTSKEDYPQIRMSVNDVGTPADARLVHDNYVQSFRDTWQRDPEPIAGLCDVASFGGNADPAFCDICGMQAVCGRYYITVNFKGAADRVTARQKQDAAVSLARVLLKKQPFVRGL